MRKKVLLVWVALLPLATLFGQNLTIKGRVIEQSGEAQLPVAYATVALLKEDSTLVSGVACGQDGKFSVEKVSPGDYLLVVSYVGYNTVGMELKNLSRSLDVGDLLLSESAVELEGVTVRASGAINKVDRTLLFPSQSEIARSANGLELLSAIKLNGIEINRLTNSVSGSRGGSVSLRINGVPATDKDILGIRPKDVIRIEHHQEPSLRYGNVEAVIDYIVRKKETGGSVLLEGMYSPNMRWADDFVKSKFNYKKSELSLYYNYYSRGYKKSYRENEEVYHFDDGSTLVRLEDAYPDNRLENVHTVRLGYTLTEPDKYTFVSRFRLVDNRFPRRNFTSYLYDQQDRDNGVLMTDFGKSTSVTPSLDLYYQQQLKNKQLFAANLVGTYIHSTSSRTYREERQEQYITDIYSGINGDKYSLIGEGVYEKGFSSGRLSVGVKHTWSSTKNSYRGNVQEQTDMVNSATWFYADWMGKLGPFSYGLGVGGTRTHVKQEDKSYSDVRFSPSLLLSYQLAKNMQLRYRGQSQVSPPSLGDLNDVEQIIDSLQIRRGNPFLKPVSSYSNRISFSYNHRLVRLNVDLSDNYAVKPIMESVYREGDKFVRTMENQKRWHNFQAALSAKVTLVDDHLFWSGRGGMDWFDSVGKDYSHHLTGWFFRTELEAFWKSWMMMCELVSQKKHLRGEVLTHSGGSSTVGVGYRWRNLQAVCFVNWTFQDKWVSYQEKLNRYSSARVKQFWPEFNGVVGGKLTWDIEFGRRYRSSGKKINNVDNDSGILNTTR